MRKKKLLAYFLGWMISSAVLAGEVWEPLPGSGSVETQTVRIVKQGKEHLREDEGASRGISSIHRFRVVTNSSGMLGPFNASKDRQFFHDHDVDADGTLSNDTVEAHTFSMNNPLTPDAPFYDLSVGSQRFYGGLSIYTADTTDPAGFSEDGMNGGEEGNQYQPRRNWTYFNEIYDIYHPFQAYGVWVWKKDDFLNGGSDYPVSFDENSVLAHLVMRYYMGMEGFRWIVRNNDQFYISEAVYEYADETPGKTGGKVHQICPLDTQWAEYDPETSAHLIHFETNSASYASRTFTNVTGVGYYLFKDRLVSGYLGYKWYTFEARATVKRPVRPGESINMVEVPGAGGVQDFYLSTCEVPYDLWQNVYRLANNNVFCLNPRGASFDNGGDMGSMDYPDTNGVYFSHTINEPVTDVTFPDVIAWCNALSVQESREPVYYEEAVFSNIFLEVKYSPHWLDAPTNLPDIYVKWDADGYRLPTPREWERAHEAGSQQYTATDGWIDSNAAGTTHAVGSLSTNALGMYDMAGNVWEWVWLFGDMLDSSANSDLLALGGGLNYPNDPTDFSASAYGDKPYDGNCNIGFRLVRRDAGLADPDTGTEITGTIPQWSIAESDQNEPDPARQLSAPLAANWLAQKDIPEQAYAVGLTEVTFAEWQPVYNWAKANGYEFDYDADMGSMAYWGWGTHALPKTHGPDEPATGMNRLNAIVWLNALSELEGRTPVYCLDSNLTQTIKAAFVYRPLMMTLGEGNDASTASQNEIIAWPVYYLNGTADGYRLPDEDEFQYVAEAGITSNKYPWGSDSAPATGVAWILDNSDLTTHPVGQKGTNAWGFCDMIGNVSEMSETSGTGMYAEYAERLGLGFFDFIEGYPRTSGRGVHDGLCYPDVGLRVLRQNPAAQASAKLLFPSPEKYVANNLMPVADLVFDPADFDNLEGKVHRNDLGRSGVFAATGVTTSPRQRWKFQTGGPVKSSPVVVNGTAYFGSWDGNVYAVNIADRSLVWSYQTGDKVSGSAAVVSNTVFIAGENGNLYSFNATDGSTNWVADVPGGKRIAGSPAVAYGTVFIGAGKEGGAERVYMGSGKMYGFDVETGAEIWVGPQGPQGYGAVALGSNTMFLSGGGANGPRACSISTGVQSWYKSIGKQNRSFMSVSYVGGEVYAPGAIRGSVSRHDPLTGSIDWLTTTLPHNDDETEFEMNSGGLFGYEIFTDLAVANGRLYAGCNDGKLHTFDQTDGSRGWTFPTGGKVQSSPAVAGDLVYFGSWDGRVYAVNAVNGKGVWSYDLGERIISSPWPGDGTLTIGCDDGAVYCLEEGVAEPDVDGDGLPDWWEIEYFGGPTNADPIATASNGINTVRQTYIAGLNPADPDAIFLIDGMKPLHWHAVSGRVYNIYWTSNLLENFQTLETNVSSGVFTDLLYGTESKGFYKIDVRINE